MAMLLLATAAGLAWWAPGEFGWAVGRAIGGVARVVKGAVDIGTAIHSQRQLPAPLATYAGDREQVERLAIRFAPVSSRALASRSALAIEN